MTRKTQEERDKRREKDVSYCMRMTKAQQEAIRANMKLGNYENMNDYLIDMGMKGYIVTPVYPYTKPVSECAWQIQKIGVNINQIAHRVNAVNVFNDYDFAKLLSLLEECKHIIKSAFSSLLE